MSQLDDDENNDENIYRPYEDSFLYDDSIDNESVDDLK